MGQMKKSYANVNTYVRNGQNVISSKPLIRKDAKTVAQQSHRAGFKLITTTYPTFGGYIEVGYPVRSAKQTAFNAFVAENFPRAIVNSGETPVIDYSELKVSKGTLTSMNLISATVNETGLVATFQTNAGLPNLSSADVAILLVKTISGRLYVTKGIRGSEDETVLTVPIENLQIADVECVYLIMTTADGKKAADSVFVELTA